MMATGKIIVHVDKALDGQGISLGVPTRVRPVSLRADDTLSPLWRVDHTRPIVSVTASVGNAEERRSAELEIGEYEVEAILPSGELLVERLQIKQNTTTQVNLRSERFDDERRGWSSFAGSRQPNVARSKLERSGNPYLLSAGIAPSSTLEVSTGTLLRYAATDASFNPASWYEWFNFLSFRYERRDPASREGLMLQGDANLFEIHKEGGAPGMPLRVTLQQRFPVNLGRSTGKERFFFCVQSESGTRIGSIPGPMPYSLRPSIMDVMAIENEGQLICDSVLLDERFGGLVAYFSAGQINLAAELFRQAKDALFEKNENPLGAAIGGYVLLSAPELYQDSKWPIWLRNLSNRFPHLPDAKILRARWLIERGGPNDRDRAHDLFYNAVDLGIPFFSAGVVWLIDGLRRFAGECSICRQRLETVRGVARSMDLSQAFTSFNLTRPQPETDKVPVPVHGYLSDELVQQIAHRVTSSYVSRPLLTYQESTTFRKEPADKSRTDKLLQIPLLRGD